jgi:beta-lactamase regulating signal transducer with metallopeptidase domain
MAWETIQTGIDAWASALWRCLTWGSLVLLLAGFLAWHLRNHSPRLRSWIWRIAHTKVLLLLLGIGAVSLPGWELSWHPTRSVAVDALPGDLVPISIPHDPAETIQPEAFNEGLGLGLGCVLSLWMLGFAWNAWRLIRQWLSTQTWVRTGESPRDPELAAALTRWRAGAEGDSPARRCLKRRIRIVVHEDSSSPQLAGILRPTLLLPANWLHLGNKRSLEAVLEHEFRHVEGHDLLWRWLRAWLRACLFFHPLLTWSDRRAAITEEMVCDHAAVTRGPLSPAEYGRTLFQWVAIHRQRPGEGSGSTVADLSQPAQSLAERLSALGSPRRPLRRHHRALTAILLAVLAGLGWVTFGPHRDVVQRDARFPVLGFHVSRGKGHSFQIQRESLRVLGLALTRVHTTSGPDAPIARAGLPSRLAGWLQRCSVQPDFQSSHGSLSFSSDADGYAFFVRFESQARLLSVVRAELLDEMGETIPLLERDDLLDPGFAGIGCLKVWLLEPGPITPGRFDLRLVDSETDGEVALLRLGSLGGNRGHP